MYILLITHKLCMFWLHNVCFLYIILQWLTMMHTLYICYRYVMFASLIQYLGPLVWTKKQVWGETYYSEYSVQECRKVWILPRRAFGVGETRSRSVDDEEYASNERGNGTPEHSTAAARTCTCSIERKQCSDHAPGYIANHDWRHTHNSPCDADGRKDNHHFCRSFRRWRHSKEEEEYSLLREPAFVAGECPWVNFS
jgi:hypothetical protein